jgi:non-canonical (house-cleaning) NTP pyrophosphatase
MGLDINVGSLKTFKVNSVKDYIAERGYSLNLAVKGVEVSSSVAEQPFSKEETMRGAINRSISALQADRNASFGFGLEGGVFQDGKSMYVFDIAAVTVATEPIQTFCGESPYFLLPSEVAELLHQGYKLSAAMQKYLSANGYDIEETTIMQNGASYYLTNGAVNRDTAQRLALENAMQALEDSLT